MISAAKNNKRAKSAISAFPITIPPSDFQLLQNTIPGILPQIQYNYIDPHLLGADQLYQTLENLGIPCMVMEPVRGGFLANLPEEFSALFREYDPKRSPAAWALKWVASHSNVKVTLSGMSNMGTVDR